MKSAYRFTNSWQIEQMQFWLFCTLRWTYMYLSNSHCQDLVFSYCSPQKTRSICFLKIVTNENSTEIWRKSQTSLEWTAMRLTKVSEVQRCLNYQCHRYQEVTIHVCILAQYSVYTILGRKGHHSVIATIENDSLFQFLACTVTQWKK